MKKIGEGWQYATYDLGNGRVLKKFHSFFGLYWAILKDVYPFKDDPIWEVPKFVSSSKKKALHSVMLVKQNKIPYDWIGNPKFLNDLDYEQDKAKPLHDVFLNSDTSHIKSLIDEFINFNKRILDRGVVDKSFNITKNFGLNSNGDLIMIDIGELFDNPQRVKKQLTGKVWRKKYVAGEIKDIEAQKYFIEQMDKNFK